MGVFLLTYSVLVGRLPYQFQKVNLQIQKCVIFKNALKYILCQSFFQSLHCYVTRILMIHSCQRLEESTRQTETDTIQLLVNGHRNMQCENVIIVHENESCSLLSKYIFVFTFLSTEKLV